VDLRFPGFVANLKLGCMAETIRTELGKKSRSSKKICPKRGFNFEGNFRESTIWFGMEFVDWSCSYFSIISDKYERYWM